MIEGPPGPFTRARIALLLLSPVLLMTFVAVVVSLIALARLEPGSGGADAGLARVGNDLALVIVTDGGADVAATRSLIATWGLLAPAGVLLVGSAVAWRLSGRVLGTVAAARAHVANADAERDSHLQEVVHELRTPLAVMGTNLELAGMGSPDGKHLDAARRAVGRMSRTVDDLAGHGRLAVTAAEESLDLAAVARAYADEHEGPGRRRGVLIAIAGSGPLAVRRVDPAAVRAAVGNFMSNAMRLAPQGSTVTIDWGRSADWAWLSVTDEGPGLAPHEHARAFERGWQGSHDRARREGSGLGLTIARQLTEAQGGLVTLDSEEGGGATLALWLPASAVSDPGDVVLADGVHPRIRPWVKQPVTV